MGNAAKAEGLTPGSMPWVSVPRVDNPGACPHPHTLMLVKCLLLLPGPFLLPEITLFQLPNTQVQQEKKEREKESWK